MNAVALPSSPFESSEAKLPATYEAAKAAIAECSRVDECKGWSDKAAALASYARMARDDSLRVMAVRIQARAERRCGELLKQIPPDNGSNQNIRDGAVPKVTRESAATEAGLSERQRKTAIRVANIPEPAFETAIEADTPPTITELAARGTVARTMVVRDEIEPAPLPHAQKAQSLLRELAAFCGANSPAAVAVACKGLDVDAIRGYVETIDAWLDRFVTNLPDSGEAFY